MVALYQLSYSPEGNLKLPNGRRPSSMFAAVGSVRSEQYG